YQRLAVEILVSGFVFEERDFLRPWEGQIDNMERYALQWESKHLGFLSAFAWPATLLWLTDIIDSKWTIAVNRIY
nr:hypothetical protein [Tanacetum cinerariifolium]